MESDCNRLYKQSIRLETHRKPAEEAKYRSDAISYMCCYITNV